MSSYPINHHGVPGTSDVLEQPLHHPRPLRVACIGAGISGIYIAAKLPRVTEGVVLRVYEKNPELGGTWWENTYPGCCCDIPSHVYSYSFESNPEWPSFFSGQPAIQSYLLRTAEKYDCRKYMTFNHTLLSAIWDDVKGVYNLVFDTPTGEVRDQCEVLINATGFLNAPVYPNTPNLPSYKGKLIHSARWDHEFSLKDKRVGLIGSGSSGIQILPKIVGQCREVVAYIRQPTWVVPGDLLVHKTRPAGYVPTPEELAKSGDFEYPKEQIEEWKRDKGSLMKYRKEYESAANNFFPLVLKGPASDEVTKGFEMVMRARLAKKPAVAEVIVPGWKFGCRRPTAGPYYLEALCDDKVRIVTQKLESFTETGIKTVDGEHEELDAVICATGFDTTFKPRFKFVGKDGFELDEEFSKDPKGYLTVAFAGFPNSFIVMGPNLPIINGSFIPSIEKAADYIIKAVNKIQRDNIKSMTVKRECVDEFTAHCDAYLKRTVFTDPCTSWYKNGTKDGRITAAWPGSSMHFMETLADARWEDYEYTYNDAKQRFRYLGNGVSQREMKGGDMAWYLKDGLDDEL